MVNIFADIPDELPDERFDTLLRHPAFKLERIVSRGHATASGEWYDQEADEWVLLLKGAAALRIENRAEAR